MNNWIACSERLPECEYGCETHALLFQLKSGTIQAGYYGRGGKQRDSYFRTYYFTTEGWNSEDVVAWMPMPEPYREHDETSHEAPIHAKWLINCDGYYPYCSNCREEPKSGEMEEYCPNCHAKMTK